MESKPTGYVNVKLYTLLLSKAGCSNSATPQIRLSLCFCSHVSHTFFNSLVSLLLLQFRVRVPNLHSSLPVVPHYNSLQYSHRPLPLDSEFPAIDFAHPDTFDLTRHLRQFQQHFHSWLGVSNNNIWLVLALSVLCACEQATDPVLVSSINRRN